MALTPTDLPRLLAPQRTFTWRDDWTYPEPPHWPQGAPPSLCRQSPDSRIILTPYEVGSCTYKGASDSRWGIETLRVPSLRAPDKDFAPQADDIHEGDCIVTLGRKFPASEEEYQEPLLWHPQLVIHVEPEGAGHLRVWLIRDDDVASDHISPPDSPARPAQQPRRSRILASEERQEVLDAFNLDVFCPECSARAKPILYGMPEPDFPDYYAVGGCLIDTHAPRYTCECGNTWPSGEFA